MKRAKEANLIATRISIDVGFRELKFGKFASYRRGVWDSRYRIFEAQEFFFVIKILVWIFFHLIFPCANIFFVLGPPPPHKFFIGLSLIKTRTRRAWKGFWLVCFSRFQELFLLELISCWVHLPKGWTNVVYFSVKICENFANYQNIFKKHAHLVHKCLR